MENKNLPNGVKFIVGVDEVGRGPLAGPIVFCAFKIPTDLLVKGVGRIKDSKKLLPHKREYILGKLDNLKSAGAIDYRIEYGNADKIDKIGMSKVGKICIEKSLMSLKIKPSECIVLLDGGLKAPKKYRNQKTIIKGDEKERAIAFASIAAKVWRDNLMTKLSKKYPEYKFEIHKGYGTKTHRDLIKKYGLSAIHRKSFCRNIRS